MWSVSSPPLGSRASGPAAASGRTPLMAPKRAQARAKPVARELLKSSVREEEGYADHCAVVVVTYLPPAGLLGNLCTLQ